MEEKKQFTEQDLVDTLRTYLWPQYLQYPKIQQYMEFEDLVQDGVLSFYGRMKNGKRAIDHYNEICESWKHVRNIVRLMACQAIPNWLRLNSVKYHPLSLNAPLSEEDGEAEWIDMLESGEEGIAEQIVTADCLSNLDSVKLDIVKDLLGGQTKTYMREKYKKFDQALQEMKEGVNHEINPRLSFSKRSNSRR